MIAEGTMSGLKRPEFKGKPYTFDLDRDFFHVTLHDREVCYSDYFPKPSVPHEYMIVDFDKDGRVVGIAVEGMLAQWAGKSLTNRAKVLWFRSLAGAHSVTFASKVIGEMTARAFFDSFPKFDASGRLPAYSP